MRIISPLGEGAELVVTREAIQQKFELQCLLSVAHEEYRKKFLTAEWHEIFDDLWGLDSVKVELDGSSDDKPAARETVGQAVLRQCDVLIAVWNGEQGEKGDPGAVATEALSRSIPIIWINSRPEHEICLLERGTNPGEPPRKTDLGHLLNRLKPIFEMPTDVSPKPLERFLGEKQPKPIPIYKTFRNFIARGWEKRLEETGNNGLNGGDQPAEDRWASLEEPNSRIGHKLLNGCQIHLKRADDLANTYGDIYRSLFILTYGLGAAAVFSAFFGIYKEGYHDAFWVELVLITAILILVWLGNQRFHLHERWIDYRLLAEGFRQMQYLIPLARVTPAFEVPAHLEEDPGRTWFNWYFRAIARELGMVSSRMDAAFLETYRQVLADAVKGQVKYHAETSARMELAHHRLHSLVVKWLFPATLVACLVHLWLGEEADPRLGKFVAAAAILLLSLCAVVLPAVGAAVEGISHQGEFERIFRRSKALRARLSALLTSLLSSKRAMSSKELGAQAEYFCQIQLLEQADWRAAFVTKPLTPP
ncbi:MAG: hypothetical protein QOF89_3046 [Acidobacteriota bacterium]|nr:hypothetical protein [Acidobacteriota bacterium]